MRPPLPLLCALFACAPAPGSGASFIAPIDGQTAVPLGLPLRAAGALSALPQGHPPHPDSVQVVDLGGGLVPGVVDRDGPDLLFRPEAPWASGHRYLWTLSEPPEGSRQPSQPMPEALVGDAVFQAGDGDAVLLAAIAPDGAVCLVLSRPPDRAPDLAITLRDAPVQATWELREEPGRAVLDAADPGVSLACWNEAPSLIGGESLRVWWGEAGPWRFTLLHQESLDQLTAPLRRWSGR